MKRRQLYLGLFGAMTILSVAVSSSEAGWFRWRYAEPAAEQMPAAVSTTTAPVPAVTAPAPTAAAAVAPVANPQVLPVSAAVAVPTPSAVAVPAPVYYAAPCPTGYAPGWSSTPRTSWDFGKFPPYYR